MMPLVHHLIIFWETPVSFLIKKKTCWLNKSNFKSEFARGMNNFGLEYIYISMTH